MTLRERKKKHTLDSVVQAARRLFVKQGYKATTMGEIAEASDVAVGTLYNYFKSKGEIMLAIASEDSADILKPLDVTDLKSMSVEDFLWQFTQKMLTFISHYPKPLLNELIGIFWVTGQENLGDGLVSLDTKILKHIAEIITILKANERLKDETEPDIVALSLYGMVGTAMLWYSVDPAVTIEETQKTISAMVGQFCRGILPEGELL